MIDRHALVHRHHVRYTGIDPRAPLTVGNGNFAFTADVTGLQTFPDSYPAPGRYVEAPGTLLGTQSSWGWHSTPCEPRPELADALRDYPTGRGPVPYVDLSGETSATALDGGTPAETWLRNNPHRLMLGRVALAPESVGATSLRAADVRDIVQELELWNGCLSSAFSLGDAEFTVRTVVAPEHDTLAVAVRSTAAQPPALRLSFPYGSEAWGNAADWTGEQRHRSEFTATHEGWVLQRTLDDTDYTVTIAAPGATLLRLGAHEFLLTGVVGALDCTLEFTAGPPQPDDGGAPSAAQLTAEAATHWQRHWSSGGVVDFSGSSDPRAGELERRVVLSQYLLAVNCSGDAPPQETGLGVNSWRGRFHLEMHWWHGAHFPLWGRPELLAGSLDWYTSILPAARATARRQGYAGARWPKQVAPDGRESPSDIGPFLIWQQPHPIYLAELLWRSDPSRAVLERFAPLVWESAAFMVSFAEAGPDGMHLPSPLVPAQESYGFMRAEVRDPTFELAYWSWALDVARQWRERLGLAEEPAWGHAARTMAAPHVRDGVYSAMAAPPFTIRTDHPSMLAGLGVVPQTDLIDATIMSRTLDEVLADWDWDSTWGWDYPMIAMTATRLHRPEDAVAALLMDRGKNSYLANGHNFQTDALPCYLPGNGGLLTAIALMAVGYDGSAPAPGFPRDGRWQVQTENILPLP